MLLDQNISTLLAPDVTAGGQHSHHPVDVLTADAVAASVAWETGGVTAEPGRRLGLESTSSRSRRTKRSTTGFAASDEIIVVCQRGFEASFSSARSLVVGCCPMNGAGSQRPNRIATVGAVASTSTIR